MIPEEVLKKYGCKIQEYHPGDIIYQERTKCHSYFQIIKGVVKLNNYNEDGKEYLQGIHHAPQTFGENFLFIDKDHVSNAIAVTECFIAQLPKKQFFSLLKRYPHYNLELNKIMGRRIYYKMLMSKCLANKKPKKRLMILMDYLKMEAGQIRKVKAFKIDLTRQQMADLTGLTVETVIRTVKEMESEGVLRIENRKIWY